MLEHLRECAREFGKRQREASFATLLVGTGPEMREFADKGATHQTVENYFHRLPISFPEGLRTWPRLAMAIKVGQTVLLRVRMEGKVMEEVIIGRRDALPGWTKGYEILDFGPLFDPQETIRGAEVYVRSKHAATQAEVESIADELCAIRPNWRFYVIVRQDSYFIEQTKFPFLYAFDEGLSLPTEEKYRAQKEVWALRELCRGSWGARRGRPAETASHPEWQSISVGIPWRTSPTAEPHSDSRGCSARGGI